MRVTLAQAAKLGLTNGVPRPNGREPKTKRKPDLRALEKDIQRDILSYLRGWVKCTWAVRINSAGVRLPGRGGKPGFYRSNDRAGCPDILACIAGRFVALEVKRPGEKPTADQLDCHADIERAGGAVIVATSVEDVQKWVEANGPQRPHEGGR